MEKFQSKFVNARTERLKQKALMKTRGFMTPLGTKNTNIKPVDEQGRPNSQMPQYRRRNSRQSNNNFCNIDFDYAGNTSQLTHLVKATVSNKPQTKLTREDLNWGMNLRQYQNSTLFNADTPFQYPRSREHFEPIAENTKTAFGFSWQVNKQGKQMYTTARHSGFNKGLKTTTVDEKSEKMRLDMMRTQYLTGDPGTRRYKDKYRIKNIGEVRQLIRKQTNQTTLNWMTGLRPHLDE